MNSKLILVFLIMFFGIGVAESSSVAEGVQQSKTFEWADNNQLNSESSGLLLSEVNKGYAQLNTMSSHKESGTENKARNIPIPAAVLLFAPAVLCLMRLSGRSK